MANIYFGGKNERSPIAAPSTADWSTVNPPEVVAQAIAFENARRAAEQERAMLAQYEGRDVEETAKAIEAATRMQGIRGYQGAIASGADPRDALVKYAPLMFGSKAGSLMPKLPSTIEERTINGNTVLVGTNPNTGAQQLRVIQPARDLAAEDLRKDVRTAEGRARTAEQEAEAMGRTITTVTPPGWLGARLGRGPTTNTVPIVEDAEKVNLARAKSDAASNQVVRAQQRLESYLAGKRGPVTATNAAPAALVAPAAAQVDVQEVIRRTSDGRRAVFDANTKRFLRYAD